MVKIEKFDFLLFDSIDRICIDWQCHYLDIMNQKLLYFSSRCYLSILIMNKLILFSFFFSLDHVFNPCQAQSNFVCQWFISGRSSIFLIQFSSMTPSKGYHDSKLRYYINTNHYTSLSAYLNNLVHYFDLYHRT